MLSGVYDRHASGMATELLGRSMNSSSEVLVSAWVKIRDTTRIDYHVCRGREVEFSVGGHDRFMLVTTELGLHNLVERAQAALREVQSAAAHNDETCAAE